MLKYKLYLYLIFASLSLPLIGQAGFECDGSAMLSIVDENEETTFYSLKNGSQGIFLDPISSKLPFNINAIGYNVEDQLIYGIDPERHDLFRFDAEGNIESLTFLPLEGDFYAGDVSPQGGMLTLMNSDSIAFVDLSSIESPIQYLPIQTSLDSVDFIFTTDIAFHPTTQLLYGFDAILGKLIIIDPSTGIVDNATYPSIGYNSSIPALYFDARGVLYGIATDNMDQSAILFEFDLETGEALRTSVDGNVGDRDACSCPYTLKLFQELSSYQAFPCDEIEIILTISNLNNQLINNASLEEEFPPNFIIKEVNSPFQAPEVTGLDDHVLKIGNLDIPTGIHEINVVLEVSSFAFGQFEMQAELIIPPNNGINNERILSDDVLFPSNQDGSILEVYDLKNTFEIAIPDTLELCPDDSVNIDIPISENLNYLWNDGITSPSRAFEEAGDYSLKISTNCDSIVLGTKVLISPFEVDLGIDQTVNFGSVLLLEADVNSISPVISYKWFNQDVDIPCFNCPSIQINPKEDSEYSLILENEAGCTASDNVLIKVTREIYAPNAISPDANGFNDFFYFQTANPPLDINYIKIYDRWGSQVFFNENITTNVESSGWNGSSSSKKYAAGVYLWVAEFLFPDGKTELRKGSFMILK